MSSGGRRPHSHIVPAKILRLEPTGQAHSRIRGGRDAMLLGLARGEAML